MKFRLRAPATSANLGPGFDCLGLALDLWNEVEVECLAGEGGVDIQLEGEGASQLPADESHLLVRVALESLRQHGVSRWPRLRLSCLNRLPLARGLGSSAATRVLGIMLAQRLRGCPPNPDEVFAEASRHEGHPDNVAAAVFGGLTCSLEEPDGSFCALSWPIHSCWRVVVAIPHFPLETERSRGAVPTHLPRADAVFNLARQPWLLRGLSEGRPDWVARGCEDRWHQSQRAEFIPGMAGVFRAAREAGACAAYLSGAGPTLAAFVDEREASPERVLQAMEGSWHGQARCRVLGVVSQGAHVQEFASA